MASKHRVKTYAVRTLFAAGVAAFTFAASPADASRKMSSAKPQKISSAKPIKFGMYKPPKKIKMGMYKPPKSKR